MTDLLSIILKETNQDQEHGPLRPPAEERTLMEQQLLPQLQAQAEDGTVIHFKFVVDKHGRPALLFGIRMEELLVVQVFRATGFIYFTLKGIIHGATGEIADIENPSPQANAGLGTALLQFAEDIFRQNGVSQITGRLSPVDADHRDRQVHFYRKNGYTVTLRKQSGRIYKRLGPITGEQT